MSLTASPAAAARTEPRWLFLVILAGLGMVGPFSIDTMFPAFARMGAEWGVGEIALQQIVSVYLLSFAVMSLVHGPLSDALGRKPVIVAGTIAYIGASIGCALAPSLPVLLGFRALQGLSAGAGAIISQLGGRLSPDARAAQAAFLRAGSSRRTRAVPCTKHSGACDKSCAGSAGTAGAQPPSASLPSGWTSTPRSAGGRTSSSTPTRCAGSSRPRPSTPVTWCSASHTAAGTSTIPTGS